MNISNLPFEVLHHIISFLATNNQALFACCLVNRRFLDIATRFLWQRIVVSPQTIGPGNDTYSMTKKLHCIASILKGNYHYDSTLVDHDASSQSIKRKLSLVVGEQESNLQDMFVPKQSEYHNPYKRSCIETSAKGVTSDFVGIKHENIDIGLGQSPLFRYGGFVRSFTMGSCKFPSELDADDKRNVADLLDAFNRLETVEVERVYAFDDYCVARFVAGNRFIWLRSFYAVGVSITDLSVELLTRKIDSLVELSLIECHLLTDTALEHIAENKAGLKLLDFSASTNISSHGLSRLTGKLSSLEVLGLGKCVRLAGAAIVALCHANQRLRVLAINENPNLQEEHFVHLASLCIQLTNLNVEKCVNFSDRSFIAFMLHCKDLISLSTTYCRRLTNESLNFVANTLKVVNLQEVFFGKCILFSPDALARFFVSTPSLKRVYLAGNAQVDDSCILSLIKSCPKLEVLSVPGCSVTDISVNNACCLRDTLTVVQFSFCRNISLNAIGHMAYECYRLSILQLVNCTQFANTFVPLYSNPCPSNLSQRYGNHYYAIRSQNIQRLGFHWKHETEKSSLP